MPALASLVFFNKAKRKIVLLILGTYCILFFLLNIYFLELQALNKSLYYFIYTLLEYLTFAGLIFINLKNRKTRLFGLYISISFVVFLYLFNFVVKFRKFDSISIAGETLVLLIFAICFFYEQFKNPSLAYIYNHYCFWLTIGILIYLCGSLFIYVFADQGASAEIIKFWFFTYIVEIIKNLLFTVAIIIFSRKPIFEPKKLDIPYLDIKELS